jgi:hypothetical protein
MLRRTFRSAPSDPVRLGVIIAETYYRDPQAPRETYVSDIEFDYPVDVVELLGRRDSGSSIQ